MRISSICGSVENVDLVHDDDDLLAPTADLLEKRALGFGEGAIGRRHEQDEIGSRYELCRDRFVFPDDGVGARGVDDMDFAEDLGGCGDDVHMGFTHMSTRRVAVFEDIDLCGRGCHALGRDSSADERVDERALPGIEFANDHQQKQLIELLDRAIERLLMLRRRVEADQCRAQPRQHAAFLAHQLIFCAGQNPGQHSPAKCII